MRLINIEPQGGGTPNNISQVGNTTVRMEDSTQQSLVRQERALEDTQRILRESSASVTQSRLNQAQAKQSQGGGIVAAAEVGAQLLGRFVDIQQNQLERKKLDEAKRQEQERIRQEAEAKQKEAELKARQEAAKAAAQDRGQELILQQREKGTAVTLEQIRALRTEFPDLTDKDYAALSASLFNDLEQNDDSMFQSLTRKQEEYREAKLGQAQIDIDVRTGGLVAQLRHVTDPSEQAKILGTIDEEIARLSQSHGLSGIDVLILRNKVYRGVLDSTKLSANQRADLYAKIEQSRSAWTELQKLEDMRDQITEQQYRAARQDVLNRYPLANVDLFLDRDGANKLAYDRENLNLGMAKLQKEGYEFTHSAATISNQEAAEAALYLLQDPSARVNYEVMDTGNNRRVLELADALEPVRKRLQDPNRRVQLQSLYQELATAQSQLQQIQEYAADPARYLQMKEAKLSVPSDISAAAQQQLVIKIQSAQEKYRILSTQYQQDLQFLAQYGITYDDSSGQLGLDASVAQERAKAKQASGSSPPPAESGAGGTTTTDSGLPSGFSAGWGGFPSPAPATHTNKGATGPKATVKTVPAAKKVWTDHWDHAHNPGAHKFDFTIEDKQGRVVTDIPSPVTGTIVDVYYQNSPSGGYGHMVSVKDESSDKYYLFAHLAQAPNLKVGQRVTAGQSIGLQGNTGTASTGNPMAEHVHMEIWEGGIPWQGGRPVRDRSIADRLASAYVDRIARGDWPTTAPSGHGLPPLQGSITQHYKLEMPGDAPHGALILPGSGYIYQGKLYFPKLKQVSGVPSTSEGTGGSAQMPVRQGRASVHRKDYPPKNNPNNNYGYSSLAQDKDFAKALAGVADRLGFPAVWLADVMAVESTQGFVHNPAAMNSEGAVGLIQFYPGGGLAEVAQEMGVSESEASHRLRTMTRAQQMRWVEFYLNKKAQYASAILGRPFKYERMEDVFAAVWGGINLLTTPHAQRGGSDSNIDYAGYLNMIGSHAGRTYNHHLTRGSSPTHTSFVPGCPTCERMHKTGSIVPHVAP